MITPFGPQLVGQTEKTLQALLRQSLTTTGLDERQWVTLRLATQDDGRPLTVRAADLARFDDADQLVSELEHRGLLKDDAPTAAGDAVLQDVLSGTTALWNDIPDAEAAARALSLVLERARLALASM
jgi:hypothetical protein